MQTIQNLTSPSKTNAKIRAFYEQTWFMWSCIGIGVLALALFSINLLKEVK